MKSRSFATALALTLTATGALAQGLTGTANMMDADGNSVGVVTLREGPQGTLFEAEIDSLPEGGHGFHIHETGSCMPMSSAGEHYAPDGLGHGFLSGDGPHAGDLPNIYVAADGVARVDVYAQGLTIGGDLKDADGSAIIIHAEPDDYLDADSAGDRIACGIIE